MSLNFRWSYRDDRNYVDMFPKVSLDSVEDYPETKQAYQFKQLTVQIPVTNDVVQNIAISTTPKMVNSYFEMHLNGDTEDMEKAYDTIIQAEVKTNQLVLTRLYRKPTVPIEVTLVFYEQKGVG